MRAGTLAALLLPATVSTRRDTCGPPQRTARTFGEPVKDDGLPTPDIRARGTGGPRGRGTPPNAATPDPFAEAARGQFRVKWVRYRGAGKARIAPDESVVLGADSRPTPTEGKSSTKVTFDRPGSYTLRAYALDGDAYSASTSAPRSALLAAMILACCGGGTSS